MPVEIATPVFGHLIITTLITTSYPVKYSFLSFVAASRKIVRVRFENCEGPRPRGAVGAP